MRAAIRIGLALVAIVAVGAAGVHYAASEGAHWPYPTNRDVGTHYASHVGERTFLWGTVTGVDGDAGRLTIRVGYTTETFEGRTTTLAVTGFDGRVQPGGTVQVLGRLRSGHVLAAESVRVVNPAASSKLYKYGVSAVGALLVLAYFLRHWRVNVAKQAFEPR
ncbi:MAG: hypothetical protein ABEJ89_00465 [Haloarculaceae archaeon]